MTTVSIILLIGVPFLLLYGRKRKWNTCQLKKIIIIGFVIVGFIGYVFSSTNAFKLFFYSFLVTPVFIMVDYLLKNMSIKKHNRDFNLLLPYSDDTDGIVAPMRSSKFKKSDIIFSAALQVLIIGLAYIGIELYG